jgi:hypothetical protein
LNKEAFQYPSPTGFTHAVKWDFTDHERNGVANCDLNQMESLLGRLLDMNPHYRKLLEPGYRLKGLDFLVLIVKVRFLNIE